MKTGKKVAEHAAGIQKTNAVSDFELTEYQRGKRDFADYLQFMKTDVLADATSALRSISQLLDYGGESGNGKLDGFAAYGLSMLLDKCADDLEQERRMREELLYQAINGSPSEAKRRRLQKLEAKMKRARVDDASA